MHPSIANSVNFFAFSGDILAVIFIDTISEVAGKIEISNTGNLEEDSALPVSRKTWSAIYAADKLTTKSTIGIPASTKARVTALIAADKQPPSSCITVTAMSIRELGKISLRIASSNVFLMISSLSRLFRVRDVSVECGAFAKSANSRVTETSDMSLSPDFESDGPNICAMISVWPILKCEEPVQPGIVPIFASTIRISFGRRPSCRRPVNSL